MRRPPTSAARRALGRGAPTARALLALAFAVGVGASSARADVDTEHQVWSAAFVRADLEEAIPRVHLWLDVSSFRGALGTDLAVRPALGVRLTDWGILWAGYTYAPTALDSQGRVDEHRFFQQLTGRWASPRLELDFWGRLEQRMRPETGGVAFRARMLGRLRAWLGESSWLFVLSNELFLAMNDTAFADSGLDQNRLFAGFGLQATSVLRFEMGYGVRLAPAPAPSLNGLHHQLVVHAYVDLGVRRD